MKATQDRHSNVTITYNAFNGDMLLSPNGDQHLLPCDVCAGLAWHKLTTATYTCDACNGKVEAALDAILPIDRPSWRARRMKKDRTAPKKEIALRWSADALWLREHGWVLVRTQSKRKVVTWFWQQRKGHVHEQDKALAIQRGENARLQTGKRVAIRSNGDAGVVVKVIGRCLFVKMDTGEELSGARQYWKAERTRK